MVVDKHILMRSLLSGFVLSALSIVTMTVFIPSTAEDKFLVHTMIAFFLIGFGVTLYQLGSQEATRRKHRAAREEQQAYNPQSDHNKSTHK